MKKSAPLPAAGIDVEEEAFAVEPGERIIASTVDAADAGQRLDLWLSRRFTYQSRRQWQDAIREGQIRLNDRPVRCSRLLQAGETVTFRPDRDEPPVTMRYDIIYEDEFLYAVDKGGNLPCHPAGPFFRHTLWYDLTRRYGKVYIINRLDRETSGIMLLGKTSAFAARMANLFQTEAIQKKYYALVYGNFDAPIHAAGYLLDTPAGPVRKKRRFVMAENDGGENGESAETQLLPVLPGTDGSLVEAVPKTGRLHQIRATLCSLGFPLLGDKLYGPDETIYLRFIAGTMTPADRELLRLPRQALHARALEFRHPVTAAVLSLAAPLPPDLRPGLPSGAVSTIP